MPNFSSIVTNKAENHVPWLHYDFTDFLTQEEVEYFIEFKNKHHPNRFVKDIKGNRVKHEFSNDESTLIKSIYDFFCDTNNFRLFVPGQFDQTVYFTAKLNYDSVPLNIVKHDDSNYGKILTMIIGLDSTSDGTELRTDNGDYVLTKTLSPGSGYFFHPVKGKTIHSVGLEYPSYTERLTLMFNYYAIPDEHYLLKSGIFQNTGNHNHYLPVT